MKQAYGKKKLVEVVPLSIATIEQLERNGDFPKRFYITDRRAAWNADEVEAWLDERQANGPKTLQTFIPPSPKKRGRPPKSDSGGHQ
ncbi:helix-turn-helix transcriptional regulator [Pectobacterium cacticida]|uniref:helix-turn-helix transcriptional regulator n=1 Tax=Pectobacterium cacticida TaxID=69221 RepID=UPI0039880FFB